MAHLNGTYGKNLDAAGIYMQLAVLFMGIGRDVVVNYLYIHRGRGTDMRMIDCTDGAHGMVPRERMPAHVRKVRDFYDRVPGAPLVQREFGFYSREAWAEQGLPLEADLAAEFSYDPPGEYPLKELGWCEAAFAPEFETEVLEDRGDHELVRDVAGRHVLFFKGRRSGFMPEYVDHPVKDRRSWEEDVKWRLDPTTQARYVGLEDRLAKARAKAAEGYVITQRLIGGYMYLRSLMGPAELLFKLVDEPELIHDCMDSWLSLADAVIARHQEMLTLDQLFLAEDICYNKGALISPDMMREFLFPYYQQLIANIRGRQLDPQRKLHISIDTDGFCDPVLPVYGEIGMTVMSPFEVASGCDVVRTGREYPELICSGGIDKRVLATTPAEIDRMVERILPPMRERGGYTPTCDHGVPAEVSLANYRHYRRRCLELGA